MTGTPDSGNFLIMGSSFSGTTLLSTLLGRHTRIVNVGEFMCYYCWHEMAPGHPYLHRKSLGPFDPNRALCAECHAAGRGPSCPVWGHLPRFEPKGLLRQVREYRGYPWLVDSTKLAGYYSALLDDTPDDNYVFVVLHKPVWGMLASQAAYLGYGDKGTEGLTEQERSVNVGWWLSYYEGFRRIVEGHLRHPCVKVRYESLAIDPVGTLHRILRAAGLDYEPGQLTGGDTDSHQISGNVKVQQQARNGGAGIRIQYDRRISDVPLHIREAALRAPRVKEMMLWLGRGDQLM